MTKDRLTQIWSLNKIIYSAANMKCFVTKDTAFKKITLILYIYIEYFSLHVSRKLWFRNFNLHTNYLGNLAKMWDWIRRIQSSLEALHFQQSPQCCWSHWLTDYDWNRKISENSNTEVENIVLCETEHHLRESYGNFFSHIKRAGSWPQTNVLQSVLVKPIWLQFSCFSPIVLDLMSTFRGYGPCQPSKN